MSSKKQLALAVALWIVFGLIFALNRPPASASIPMVTKVPVATKVTKTVTAPVPETPAFVPAPQPPTSVPVAPELIAVDQKLDEQGFAPSANVHKMSVRRVNAPARNTN